MAKMGRYENLPQIFKENNLFLLPISRKGYAIIKGNVYHNLETIDKKFEMHLTSNPFPDSAIGTESESVFLEYANSCGLLEKLCQTKLFKSIERIRIIKKIKKWCKRIRICL